MRSEVFYSLDWTNLGYSIDKMTNFLTTFEIALNFLASYFRWLLHQRKVQLRSFITNKYQYNIILSLSTLDKLKKVLILKTIHFRSSVALLQMKYPNNKYFFDYFLHSKVLNVLTLIPQSSSFSNLIHKAFLNLLA